MKKKQISLFFTFLALILLAACVHASSSKRELTTTTQNLSPEAVNLPVTQEKTFEQKWDDLVRAAQKEGTVIVYNSQPKGISALTNIFKEKFGLRLEAVGGTPTAMASRVTSEHRFGIYLVDVLLTGRNSPPFELLEPLAPSLLLPELTDPELIKKTWWRGKLWWMDDNPAMLASQAAPASLLVINTNLVKPGELKSYRNLLDPKWKGKIAMVDPTTGTGLNCIKVLSTQIMSKNWEFARELAKQEPVITRDERLHGEWVARGKYAIGFAPNSGVIAEFQEAGAPIDFVTPEEGAFIGSGSTIVTLVISRPHPNAAKLFLNFFLGKEGQTIFTQSIGVHSAREDVPTEGINPYKLRQPGVKYYLSEFNTPKDAEIVKQIFGHLAE